MNRTGQTIDARYLVERRLGTGGMAEVYACEDLQLGRRVALKVLHEQLAQDEQVVARFRRESQSAAGLQHPHIVQVFDRGDWDGIPYMAMELVDGVTLKDVIRDQAPLDPVKSIDQISQVLDALRYAHRRGLVHRDIKPQNVLVGADGELKVADFGIARAVDDLQMTQTGMIVGTAHYLSPEQASGQPVTPSADLYAVGVVLFEMLTGRMPFEGDQPVAVALKHVNEEPPALSVVNPKVPADLEYVVMKAMAKAPEDRFEDAESFVAALQAVRHRIVSGAPEPEFGPLTTGAPGTPVLGVGGVQATGGWLQPAAGMAVPAGVGPEEAQEEAASRRRRRWALAIVGGLALLVVLALIGYLAFGRTETVPDVRGDSQAKATQRLQARGLEVLVDQDSDPQVPEGTVIRQSPAAKKRVRRGTQVRIVVSTGRAELTVPTVANLPVAEAKKQLQDAGFTNFADVRESSDTVASGRVIGTTPAADSLAAPGDQIALHVSTGPAADGKITLPDLTGLTREQASAALKRRKLSADFVEQDSDKPVGTVLRQSPAARKRVDPDSTVTLTLARKKAPDRTSTTTTPRRPTPSDVTVPNLQGRERGDAEAALKKLKLTPRATTVNVTDKSEDGKVVNQVPNGGKVARGSRVDLSVGHYVPPPPTTTNDGAAAGAAAAGGDGEPLRGVEPTVTPAAAGGQTRAIRRPGTGRS